MKDVRKLVLLSLMVAQALVLSIVESWIPVTAIIPVPGIKLGLANIITLIVIIFFGLRDALFVVVVRCVLSSIFVGGPIIFLFSITGGIFSTIVMAILYKKLSKDFSIIGLSIAGAISHNIGQLTTAGFIMKDFAVFVYLPILLISGTIMGCFVGMCTNLLSKALRNLNIFK